jgi:hypothetical protein
MIKVRTTDYQYPVNTEQKSYGVGDGVTVRFLLAGTVPPPVITNGILLEDNTYFLMLEDTTSYLLQEA